MVFTLEFFAASTNQILPKIAITAKCIIYMATREKNSKNKKEPKPKKYK